MGAFAEGIAVAEEGLRLAEVVNHPTSLETAYTGAGAIYLHKGDLPKALPLLERALGLCQEANLPYVVLFMASQLGLAYVLSGRVDEAVPLLNQRWSKPS